MDGQAGRKAGCGGGVLAMRKRWCSQGGGTSRERCSGCRAAGERTAQEWEKKEVSCGVGRKLVATIEMNPRSSFANRRA
jgi:hypothetical protein